MAQQMTTTNDNGTIDRIIEPCGGLGFDVSATQLITIIDVEGEQVADFFAENAENPEEFLSTAVTIDCNESLRLNVGDMVYTNLYRPMFKIILDDVGTHDLLFPCCRQEMYDFFFKNGDRHPNCFDNINHSLNEHRPIIQPINLFMNTAIGTSGKIAILAPRTKAGDKIVLQALMDVRLGIAACSVSEGECNARKCTPIRVLIE